ncbi:uroporphyrinogen-III synthase [Flagellatimonas centrodinii]|uniref:uroporphyrinogen-III synthase n=1 Tax=Flagellatimonas centrodinii TaxID=2806210 RepID=UPI001FFA8FA9|nr:uroporphyrinogen-III synthase [Flagellatimonas centrodinii]ULQ47592.1 uroporphyrinogen-III synthase [Flagellatimonas centrodinii]
MIDDSLAGRCIAVPETRELDLFTALLERRGASVLRCPLVAILDAPDPAPVRAWLARFCDGACDDLVLLTGEGLRRLLGCLERHDAERLDAFRAQLARVRTIVRGPKPGRVLRTLGLRPTLVAETPTSEGVIEVLRTLDLRGRRVGVQRYGSEPSTRLLDTLTAAGATPLPVSPYVYADAADDAAVADLITRLAAGQVDAIAFTSMAQVDRLFGLASRRGLNDTLRAGLSGSTVAAVGPVVADALRARGVAVDVMPGEAFFLKPLTQALAGLLAASRS